MHGSRTAYWQYGSSSRTDPAVVVVHGFRGDHHGLEGVASRLQQFRVFVPDLPGFGDSSPLATEHDLDRLADWLITFAQEVVEEPCVVIGHSFGSLVVSNAIARGLNPSAVVLLNPISSPALKGPRGALTRLALLYYFLGSKLPTPVANALLRNRLIVRAMSEVMTKTKDTALRRWIHAQHDRYFSSYSDRRTLLQSFRASVSHTVTEHSRALTMPALIVSGALDDISTLSDQLALTHQLPKGELLIVPGVGHLLHYEGVNESVAAIKTFLAQTLNLQGKSSS